MSTKRKPVFLRAMTLVILISCVVPGAFPAKSSPRVVHVFVALADNQHQGIVPVTVALGNGSDPARKTCIGERLLELSLTSKPATIGDCSPVVAAQKTRFWSDAFSRARRKMFFSSRMLMKEVKSDRL
jgi:hypothetical protein